MISRRKAVMGLAATAGLSSPAMALTRTPRQSIGPFYPDVLPSESDADLVRIGTGPAATGEEIEITGRLLGLDGRPINLADTRTAVIPLLRRLIRISKAMVWCEPMIKDGIVFGRSSRESIPDARDTYIFGLAGRDSSRCRLRCISLVIPEMKVISCGMPSATQKLANR